MVTITGANFTGPTTVDFGTNPGDKRDSGQP